MKVHVHSCPELAGRAHTQGALTGASILNWQGPIFHMLGFFQEKKKIVRIDESLFHKSVDASGARVTGRICFGQ